MRNKPIRPSRPELSGGVCLALLLAATAPALADTQDTFYITAGVTRQHDDNLFRLPSSVDLEPFIGRSSSSENITTTSVMFNINKAYSLQRFELQAGVIDYRYENFTYLNFLAKPYKGVWHWSLTPSLHGNLLTERSQSPTSFTDYRGYRKSNTQTQDRSRFDAEADLSASWHLLGGLTHSSSENDERTQGEDDYRSDSTEIGVRYSFPSGNSVRYVGRWATGEYINREDPILVGLTDNRFEDREHAVSLNWDWGGKTQFDARMAYFEREHEHFAARDYDGVVGSANVNWSISGKSYLRVGVSRQLASDQTLYSSYTETDRFTLSPYWQISDKTALRLRYDIASRDYLGAIANTAANGRSDTLSTAMIAFDWNPLRDLTLSASLQRDTRDSNVPGLEFESNMYFLSAQIGF